MSSAVMLDGVTTLAGLLLLLSGGEALVRGSSALARALGVSPRVIGITLVAFGTSAPELAVNVAAASQGHPEMCFGNVVGSNLANVGLIIGVSALFRPLAVHQMLVRRDLPIMLGVTLIACAMGLWPWGGQSSAGFSRVDGGGLLLGFVAFLVYIAHSLRDDRKQSDEIPAELRERSMLRRQAVVGLVGLIGLLIGARMTVDGATELAQAFGVSDAVIALTVLAVGTSLPELATSLVATLRGQIDLAVGNVVGSNLFNLLLVLGVSSQIAAVPLPLGGRLDLAALLIASAGLLLVSSTHSRRVLRREGAFLLGGYVGYLLLRSLWY